MSRKRPRTRRPTASRRRTIPPLTPLAAATSARHELNTKRRGELAELAFTLKAVGLGFAVAKPYGDSERYDFILDNRNLTPPCDALNPCHPARSQPGSEATRLAQSNACPESAEGNPVQPEPSSGSEGNSHHAAPTLHRIQVKCSTQLLEGLYRINAHRRINGRAVPYLPSEIDFIVAYIIPEDTWYILPLAATRNRTSLLFRRKSDPKPGLYDAYREAWHLLRPQP